MHEKDLTSRKDLVQAAIRAVRERPVPAGPPPEVIDAIARLDQSGPPPKSRAFWKTLRDMNWMARLAIAAAVVLAFTLPMTLLMRGDSPGGAAFGQVIQHFRSARSARLRLRIEQKGQPPMDSVLLILGEATRQEETNGRVTITDTEAGKSLILNPAERKAVLTTLVKSQDPSAVEAGDPFDLIEGLAALQGGAEVSLGTRTIAGRTAIGFQVTKAGMQWTIWADAESRLPLRTECHLPLFEATAFMTDFEFDVDLDPALFSLVPPEGYTLEQRTAGLVWSLTDPESKSDQAEVGVGVDFSAPFEEDLLEYLRLVAERSGGEFRGQFLSEPLQDAMAVMKNDEADPQARAEATTLLHKYTRAMMYFQKLVSEAEQGQVLPVGDGVSLGDSTRAVLIWKPADNSQFRAIFGDLSVREVSAEEFARITASYQEQNRRREREKGYLGVEVRSGGKQPRIMGRLNNPAEPPVLEAESGDNAYAIIARIIPGTAAEQAGLMAGDVLVSLDGQAVHSEGEFFRMVKKHKPGETISLVIGRGEQEMALKVTLGQRPE
jgi:hypothetical protein